MKLAKEHLIVAQPRQSSLAVNPHPDAHQSENMLLDRVESREQFAANGSAANQPERDSVTVANPTDTPASPSEERYDGLDDRTFNQTLSRFVEQARKEASEFGLTLYYRILPGLRDAQRRFNEHAGDSGYRLDGCSGVEEYIRKLGLNPATVRKWRQRENERMFLKELKQLPSVKNRCKKCGQHEGHALDCPKNRQNRLHPPETETEKELLAEQCIRMTHTLLGPSFDSPDERIKKTLRLAECVREAAAGGSYEAIKLPTFAPAEPPQPPPIIGDPVPEPEPGTLEELRQRIIRMADTRDISKALEEFLGSVIAPLLSHHTYSLAHHVGVSINRATGRRIQIGDWLECNRAGARLKKLVGDNIGLGRVVGVDELQRPTIRWHDGHEWKKPYSFFQNDGGVTVLFEHRAAERYPRAFISYPTVKAETIPQKRPQSDKAPQRIEVAVNDSEEAESEDVKHTVTTRTRPSPLNVIQSRSPEAHENIELNGIKGCTYIYAPKGQAGEYAPLACNPYRGCGHKCAYCYVPLFIKMKREEFDAGANPRPDFIKNLAKDAAKYREAGFTGQVMLSFTTDPYHTGDTELTRKTIECLQSYGLGVCTLTKGGTRALRDLDLFRADRDAFASTLTSLDDAFSLKWERSAALPGDRIKALKTFHDRGIFTWVSLEPTLDCESSLEIVERTHEVVDLYKIGRVNYLPMTKTTNWKEYTERMIGLCAKLKVAHYIKRDLQQYLPAGYKNEMRQEQHHLTLIR